MLLQHQSFLKQKYRMSTAPSKYEDIIRNCVLMQSGSPAVYLMKPKEKMLGSVRKLTVGEKDHSKKNKTILLVGETGTGKSALVNTLVNHIMGVKFEDDIWFEIVEREERSQTLDVMVYEIFGFEGQTLPYSLTIIDTPGYGDTRGIEHDVIMRQRLFDLFSSEDGVHEINVCLVMKASENRLSDRLRYIFDSVVSLFGKDMEEKIITLITHSDGTTPINVLKALDASKIKFSKNEKNQAVHFLLDNCSLTKENKSFLKNAWDLTESGIVQFTEFLKGSKPQKITSIKQLNSHIRTTACLKNLQDRLKFNELEQKEIQQIHEALIRHEQEKKKNEKFTVEVDEVYKEKETVDGGKWWLLFFKGAVCCIVCEENCHFPGCTMTENHKDCKVMKDGHCTSCTKKCPPSAHVKEKWRFVTKTRKLLKTEGDIRRKYEKTQSDKKLRVLEILQNKMKDLTGEKNQLLEESYQHVGKLEQVYLKVCSVSTYVHMDVLIEKMEEKGDTEKVQKLEEVKSQVDEGTRAMLESIINDTSSKYKDITSKSTIITSGSPAVYLLKTNIETIGTLTRKTVGEKNMNKVNKTILLVGETGTGKSTLINSLVNYTMGVKFEDNIWFEIVESEEKKDDFESQTSDVMVYEIFGFEDQTLPYSLTIIDTPGFGDTRGIEHDVIISQRLFDLFSSKDGVHEINAVGLVVKASENRLSDRLRYIFDSVVSLFGKDMEEKIVALITHSDGTTIPAVLATLGNQLHHFHFNNCQTQQRTEDNKAGLKFARDLTNKEMEKLRNFLNRSAPQKLMSTIKVLKRRIRISACIQNLQERIEFIEAKKNEIQQNQETLKNNEEEMKKNEDFTVEFNEVYKEKEAIDGMWWFLRRAVSCNNCEENCHYPGCTLAMSPKHCEIMTNGRCTVCVNKCPVENHVKENWKYVTKERKVSKTRQEMKKTYEKYKTELEKTCSFLDGLEETMKELTAEKDKLLEESYKHVIKLEEIALNVHSLSTYVHMDFLIEKMKEKGDTEKVQKLEEMNNRVDEGTKAGLSYVYKKLTTAGKVVKDTLKTWPPVNVLERVRGARQHPMLFDKTENDTTDSPKDKTNQ